MILILRFLFILISGLLFFASCSNKLLIYTFQDSQKVEEFVLNPIKKTFQYTGKKNNQIFRTSGTYIKTGTTLILSCKPNSEKDTVSKILFDKNVISKTADRETGIIVNLECLNNESIFCPPTEVIFFGDKKTVVEKYYPEYSETITFSTSLDKITIVFNGDFILNQSIKINEPGSYHLKLFAVYKTLGMFEMTSNGCFYVEAGPEVMYSICEQDDHEIISFSFSKKCDEMFERRISRKK